MSKQETPKTRYYVQWDTHARHMCTVLCSLMEHQSLVDLAICCGTNTIHAHKCVLAANSPYFREQLEKNAGTEQIIVTGLDFAIVKSIIEFMYCGETNVLDENLKYMIAAAKFFQMRGLQTLVSDNQDLRHEAELIHISPPTFLPKKPKYPNAYRPLNNTALTPTFESYKPSSQNDPYVHRKIKRKFVRSEAEKACAKEAAASRLALEALQKELASAAQMSSFVIEESCTETTVENFIPHSEETFIDNLNHIDGVPLQVVNYGDLNGSILTPNQVISINKPDCTNGTLSFGIRPSTTNRDKLKRIMGNNLTNNIEIMYRTNEGDIVNVTADVLQNLSGDALQYQIVDEHGQIRELREFQNSEDQSAAPNYGTGNILPRLENTITDEEMPETKPFMNTHTEGFVPSSNLEILNSPSNETNQNLEVLNDKLENASEIFPSIVNSYSENVENPDNAVLNTLESDTGTIPDSICSTDKPNDDITLSHDRMYDSDLFPDMLPKPKDALVQMEQNAAFSECDVNRFLNLDEVVVEEHKESTIQENEKLCKGYKSSLKRPRLLPLRKLRSASADSSVDDNSDSSEQHDEMSPNCSVKEDNNDNQRSNQIVLDNIDLTVDNILDTSAESLKQDNKENDDNDAGNASKKIKLNPHNQLSESNLTVESVGDDDVDILNDILNVDTQPPKKTRSSLKVLDGQINLNDYKESADNYSSYMKSDKPRRVMPNRKKKSN